jgi:acetyl esterase/lipase
MSQLVARIKATVPFLGFSVEAHRDRVARAEAMVPVGADAVVERVVVGGVPCDRVSTAASDPLRVLLLLHHGAFVAGSARSLHELGRRLCAASGATVLAPDYRLAPEHPFPAAVEDALACYRGLLAQGLRSGDIVVGGASAGGGIAAAALLAVRDGGLPRPAGGVLVCPMLDTTLSSPAMTAEDSAEPIDSRPVSGPAVALYLAGHPATDPLASPVLADLTGLPPLLIEAAGADRLVDDAHTFAERAGARGVRVALHVAEGAIHNFPQAGPDTPEARVSTARIATFLTEVMAAQG